MPYHEKTYNGKTYRFFPPGEIDFGDFHNFGFPSDGTDAINWKTKHTLTCKLSGYPSVYYLSTTETTKSGATWLVGAGLCLVCEGLRLTCNVSASSTALGRLGEGIQFVFFAPRALLSTQPPTQPARTNGARAGKS